MGDQVILEEDYDEDYEPTEEGILAAVCYYFIHLQCAEDTNLC